MDDQTKQWAMILHLSVFAGYLIPLAGLLAPILIWQIYKDKMPELDAHGKMVTNFMISMVIYMTVSILLIFVVIGIPLVAVLGIVGFVYPIIGGLKANNGELWNYPGVIKILK